MNFERVLIYVRLVDIIRPQVKYIKGIGGGSRPIFLDSFCFAICCSLSYEDSKMGSFKV